ncbi:hypothetical protein [Bacillus mycoides]|uniref:hypothetical protein n=1 Tax=Bacillus mycoides TaxID=1405 RepID=UPI003A8074B9
MTYEEAKEQNRKANEEYDEVAKNLSKFERNAIGLVPNHVRETPEYREAYKQERAAFARLRKSNDWFLKNFKKEYLADRAKRRLNGSK